MDFDFHAKLYVKVIDFDFLVNSIGLILSLLAWWNWPRVLTSSYCFTLADETVFQYQVISNILLKQNVMIIKFLFSFVHYQI